MVTVFQALIWAVSLGLGGYAVFKIKRTAVGIFLLVVIVGIAVVSTWAVGFMRGPAEVVGRVLQADRIMYNYDWFFNKRAAVLSYEGQIKNTVTAVEEFRKDHVGNLDSYQNSTELARLQSVLLALRNQMARDVQEYNAQAMNITRGIFKDWRLPVSFVVNGDKVEGRYE